MRWRSGRRARRSSTPRSRRAHSRRLVPAGRSEAGVFLSKIWFFLITLAAAIALTIALVMPRPANRQHLEDEHNRLALACGVVDLALADDARVRVDLASSFAR